MRVLFLDCFSGISGDMTVGALCDLGVKPSALEWELSKLDLGEWHAHFQREERQAINGVKFAIHEQNAHEECVHEVHPVQYVHKIDENAHSHSHEDGHSHSHGEHTHEGHEHSHEHPHVHGRNHEQIRDLISQSQLSEFVKTHALSMFQRIAVAEGKIHGVPPEKVAFHEVGALDSIADIVLVCAGLEMLGVDKVFVSRLHDGCGWIDCAHGRFPIPSAATLEILQGIPVRQIDEPFEFITPTGAAIVAEFGASFGLMPQMRVEKIGYGVGTRKLPSRPNVLRAVLGELDEENATGYEADEITRIETNIDDLSPEVTGAAMEKLFSAGALDVFFTPIQMKKNRPAIQLSVLCENTAASKMADLIFSETTAFGLRMDQVSRLKLARKFEKVTTPFGEISVKIGLRGGEAIQIAPEFESCKAASEQTGAPLRTVYEAARKAAEGKS